METQDTAPPAAVTAAPHRTGRIPLDQLSDRGGNVRRTPAPASAERELTASIRAHGLLENLVVVKTDDWIGEPTNWVYEIVGGRRRYAALSKLAEDGLLRRDEPIPCTVVTGADPAEVGLAENAVRVQMHDADRIDAFAGLVRGGRPVVEIANRFGVDEIEVERFLRLESVHPDIRAAHRADRLSTKVLAAYAITTDRERQLRVWKRIGAGGNGGDDHTPKRVRTMLSEGGLPGRDRLVRFVGIEAYRAAGGAICEDLFTAMNEPEALIVAEPDKLRQMAADKLQAAAVELTGRWEWADAQIERGWNVGFGYATVNPDQPGEPTADEAAGRESLETELTGIERMIARAGSSAEGRAGAHGIEDLEAEQARLKREIETIDDALAARATWSARVQGASGCIVTVDDNGGLEVIGGLVRPQDIERVQRTLNPEPDPEDEPAPEPTGDAEEESLSAAVEQAADPGRTAESTGGETAAEPAPSLVGETPPATTGAESATPRTADGGVRVIIKPPVAHDWKEKPPAEPIEPAPAKDAWTKAREQLGYSSRAVGDLRIARRQAVADALAADPKTAAAVATFHLAELAATAIENQGRTPAEARNERLPLAPALGAAAAAGVLERAGAGALMGPWRDEPTQAGRFEALMALDMRTRSAVLAEAVAALVGGQTAFEPDRSEALESAIARLQPKWRATWTPDAAFFSQLTHEKLLEIGEEFGGDEWLRTYRGGAKQAIAAAVAALFDRKAEGIAEWVPAGFEPEGDETDSTDGATSEMPAFLDAAS